MQPDTETPLFDLAPLPELPEEGTVSGCACGKDIADIKAAVARIAETNGHIVTAVNSIGEIVEATHTVVTSATQFIGEFRDKFGNMSPGDILKQLVRGG